MPVGVPEPGALAVTVAVKVTVCPRFATPGDAPAVGRGAVLVDHLADRCRGGAGVEVAVAAGVGRGDRVSGRAQRAGGERRLVLAADDAQRAGADRRAVVVEGDRAGGMATAVLPGLTTLTVAVNVTAWPYTEGLPDEATVALVFALLTTWVTAVEAGLGMKLASPLV